MPHLDIDVAAQEAVMKDLRRRKEDRWKERYEQVRDALDERMRRVIELASEKGASTWLTSIPLKSYGFRLNKQQFQDALCMRYDLRLADVPRTCACGNDYSINHCLTCKRGGHVIIRHNVVRDTLARYCEKSAKM